MDLLNSERKQYEERIKQLKHQSDERVAYILRNIMCVINSDKKLSDADRERLCRNIWNLYNESRDIME